MNKKIAVVNIKNLAVFVIMTAIAMFMAVGMASAGQPLPLHIRGVYDGTTECACVLAPFGFDSTTLTPKPNPLQSGSPGIGMASIQHRKSTFTFEQDGTGSVTGKASQISLAYTGPSGPVPPIPASATFSFDFTYTVTHDRSITLSPGLSTLTYTAGPNSGLTYHQESPPSHLKGTITPDGKIITTFADASEDLSTLSGPGLPPIPSLPTYPNLSCTCISVLTWQGNEKSWHDNEK